MIFFFILFLIFLFLLFSNGSEASRQLSIIIWQLFFLRIPAKRIERVLLFSQRRKILGNCRLWNGRKMRILEAKKEKRRKTSEAFFRVIFSCVKICKFSFSYYKDQRKSGWLRHFTNVGLFFLSIPIPGFVPSDRFAWTGPLRLSLISSVLLLLGKTKDFVFLSLIRRTHWPLELLASSSDTTGRAFRKSKTTLAGAPMVPEHEHLRLPLSLPGKLNRTWKP